MDINKKILELAEESGKSQDQIKEMINKQIEELSGLIDEEGAIVIIAKVLSVNIKKESRYDDTDLIEKFVDNASHNGSVKGKISWIGEKRTVNTKDGRTVDLRKIKIDDNSGDIPVILWGDKIIAMNVGDEIYINDCYSKFNDYSDQMEINLTFNGIISIIEKKQKMDSIKTPTFSKKKSTSKKKSISKKDSVIFEYLESRLTAFIKENDTGDGVPIAKITSHFKKSKAITQNVLDKLCRDVMIYKAAPGSYSAY